MTNHQILLISLYKSVSGVHVSQTIAIKMKIKIKITFIQIYFYHIYYLGLSETQYTSRYLRTSKSHSPHRIVSS